MRTLIGQKPMFYQSIKDGKSLFYCFARVKSILLSLCRALWRILRAKMEILAG